MQQNGQNTKRRTPKQRVIGFLFTTLAWISAALLYYVCFALLFDTPEEHRMREQTDRLHKEYEMLSNRYDSLEMILDNITQRDQSVFRILFETDPYDLDIERQEERLAIQEKNISKSKTQLLEELAARIDELVKQTDKLEGSWQNINDLSEQIGTNINNIPSIQPVLNKQLTLLTAGYGTILNPFYRTLKSHQGVDYTVGEGSSIFATADGVVKEISDKNSTLGKTIIIDHGNGYQTLYGHMSGLAVGAGATVSKGQTIGYLGSTGRATGTHCHFEVFINGSRTDPAAFFSGLSYYNC